MHVIREGVVAPSKSRERANHAVHDKHPVRIQFRAPLHICISVRMRQYCIVNIIRAAQVVPDGIMRHCRGASLRNSIFGIAILYVESGFAIRYHPEIHLPLLERKPDTRLY